MSLHADALARLTDWDPPDERQERLRARFADHLRARPDGLDRGCQPDHVTASTVVLDAAGERVLLTLHARAGRWFQLGGHCEAGDATLAGAALREAVEESGLTGLAIDPVPVHLDEHEVPFCGSAGGEPVHHLDVRFVALAEPGAAYAVSEESIDLRWWPVDALPDPSLAELVARARERQSTASAPSAPGGGSSLAAADQPSR